MPARVVAIVGSYRKQGMIDEAIDTILAAAREKGAATEKIYLVDHQIEFCTNCRACTQSAGASRGKCVHQDEFEAVMASIDAADVVVLGSPVNFDNVTAIFRRFMERLISTAYWPWGGKIPSPRNKLHTKHAVLVTSSAAPALFARIFSGSLRALKRTADVLGARPVANLCIGLAAMHPNQQLSKSAKRRARSIGLGIV